MRNARRTLARIDNSELHFQRQLKQLLVETKVKYDQTHLRFAI